MNNIDIEIENIWTKLKPAGGIISHDILRNIESDMSYTVQEYVASRKAYVDYEVPMFDSERLMYPTGLFSVLQKTLEDHDIHYDVIDKRNEPLQKAPLIIHGKELRDYQKQVVYDALKAERGIIKSAVGSGKTTMAAGIIGDLNLNTLFIVNSIDLLTQAYEEFMGMFQTPIGRVGGGYCEVEQITVCTVQTLHSALDIEFGALESEYNTKEKMDDFVLNKKEEIREMVRVAEVILVDECHHLRADTYVNMMKYAVNAYYKFGLSGTPYKMDGTDMVLKAYSGKEICSISASYLIDRGFLVKPKIYMLDANRFPKYRYMKGGFSSIYKEWIVENKERNSYICDISERLLELNKTVLITVTQIKHGQILEEMIAEKLPNAKIAFIRGQVKRDKRKKLLDQVRNKELNILIGSSVADEGLDLPALDSAILAGGGKSFVKTMQRVGRTLRPYDGKTEAIIIDFYDQLRYLSGHAKKRLEIYRMEKSFEVNEEF